eukprot:scaffold53068_cov20-Tisochrysis_lutea.AAC.2
MAGIFYPKGAVSDWCSGARGNNTDCGSGEEPPRGQKSNKHMGYIKLFALSTNISTLLHNCCKTHAVRGNWGMKQSIAVQAQHIGNDSRHDDMARFAQARKSQEVHASWIIEDMYRKHSTSPQTANTTLTC